MELKNEKVAELFSADEMVGGLPSPLVGSSFGGAGLGNKNTVVYTSDGRAGTKQQILEENASAKIGQIGGRRRQVSYRRYRNRRNRRKTQRGGARRTSHVSTSVRARHPPRLNVSIRARIRLSRRHLRR